ncbi:hypothetical protein STEG23_025102 [Scotinomys teguina]
MTAAKASGMTAARRFLARSTVTEARSPESGVPLPARLGGGAHSSSRNRRSGGDSSGAPGRAAFQRVYEDSASCEKNVYGFTHFCCELPPTATSQADLYPQQHQIPEKPGLWML